MTEVDRRLTGWMAAHGLSLLRISVGVVFLWFGVLKFVPGLSAADELATATAERLSLGLVGPDAARVLIALLETAIGLGLLTGRFLRVTLLLLGGQMAGTLTPLVLYPEVTWQAPLVPTLEGQYILKNVVLVAAGLVIGATARGGALLDDPRAVAAGREATTVRR
jgi:uncharacterized membrane protein YkgB